MAAVTIYTKTWCPYCMAAKDLLESKGIAFREVEITGKPQLRDEMIAKALAGDYVVQEVVELSTEEFPVFDDERWALQPMYVDTNPFLFRGRVEGAMVRLSDSPVVNVTSGGGETGFFALEGRLED